MVEKPLEGEHGRWEDLMIEVLDGRAPAGQRLELDGHLAACPDCRTVFEEYSALFSRLREAVEEDEPPGFWDGLASEIDRLVAEETEAGSSSGATRAVAGADRATGSPARATAGVDRGPLPSGRVAAPGEPAVIELPERVRFGGGWEGVRGGLIAAGIAIVVLVGVYLELPRQAGQPTAFVTPPRPRAAPSTPAEPETGGRLAAGEPGGSRQDESAGDADDAALVALASGLADDEYGGVTAELQDPLADLADAEQALQGLTPEEAEELLRSLEAQT